MREENHKWINSKKKEQIGSRVQVDILMLHTKAHVERRGCIGKMRK